MEKAIFLAFKKVYTELKILLEHSKRWSPAKDVEKNNLLLEESWKTIFAKNADNSLTKTDW